MAMPKKSIIVLNHGPLSVAAHAQLLAAISKLNMHWQATLVDPGASSEVLVSAQFIVGFQTFHDADDRYELWPDDPSQLDFEVNDLIARTFSRVKRSERKVVVPQKDASLAEAPSPKVKKQHTIKMTRETKGRRGKGVTILSELPPGMSVAQLEELATMLKSRCGTGGTVRAGTIEIQGDQRDRLTTECEKLGYRIKRAGG